jgi:hypothetical protein
MSAVEATPGKSESGKPDSGKSESGKSGASALFTPLAAAAMVGVGIVAFCAFVVLQAYAPDLRGGSDGGNHALSRSAVGYAGMVEMLKSLQTPVIISRGPTPAKPAAPIVLVLTPGVTTDVDAIAKIKHAGPILLVLPKWMAIPDPTHTGWAKRMGAFDDGSIARLVPEAFAKNVRIERGPERAVRPVLRGAGGLFDVDTALPIGPTESFQTLKGDGLDPLLTNDAGQMVLAATHEGQVYILSDPDLLNTHGLKNLQTSRAAVAILDRLRGQDGAVAFDVTLHGFARSRSILKLAFEPPFLGLTLCALAVAALMGLHAIARVGPVRTGGRAFALGKRALADNSAALIKLARREPKMIGGYVALTRAAVAQVVGAPRDLSPDQMDALLDRLGKGKGATEDFSTLAVAAATEVKTPADLVRTAKRLHRWRVEMTRESR